jgi:HD superfamily phosphohydrolase
VDVDKFDYLLRDCMNIGLKSSYDGSRLMKNCRVIEDEVCFQFKEAFNLYELFHTRYSLFKRIYTHKTCNAIELMVTDALVLANDEYKFTEAIYDPTQYMNLTDTILREIEKSTKPSLSASRAILKRLRTRNIYKFTDEVIIEPQHRDYVKVFRYLKF